MSLSDPGAVRVERDPKVTTVVLSNARQSNRLGADAMTELADTADAISSTTTRAVLLRAEGPHFCVGGDLSAGVGLSPRAGDVEVAITNGPQRMIDAWWEVEQPLVAAVRGHAVGLGACLALTADLILASETALLRFPYCNLGFTPDGGASWLLARRAGLTAATSILLLGEPVTASSALELGLVSAVLPDEELDEAAALAAGRLSAGAPAALRATKRLLRVAPDRSLAVALAAEAAAFETAAGTEDFGEGIRAFLEHRAPIFEGR